MSASKAPKPITWAEAEQDDEFTPGDMRRPKYNGSFLSWENIPTWQGMLDPSETTSNQNSATWQTAPQLPQNDTQVEEKLSYGTDSDDSLSESSDEEFSDPLTTKHKKSSNKPTKSKFPVRIDLNSQISIWQGDLTKLNVESIINPSSESSSSKKGIGGKILQLGGADLLAELRGLDRPRTGECRLTKGYGIVAPWILHTVGPRYNPKYITAAENALHNCYRSCFDTAYENKFRTIAFPAVHSIARQYPIDSGAHIAIRTVRRLIEHRPRAFDRLIFTFEHDQTEAFQVYCSLLKLYFPRNKDEEEEAKLRLPKDTGNEYGETVIEERKIRINATFTGSGFSTRNEESEEEDSISGDDDDQYWKSKNQSKINSTNQQQQQKEQIKTIQNNSIPNHIKTATTDTSTLPKSSQIGTDHPLSDSSSNEPTIYESHVEEHFPASLMSMTTDKDSERRIKGMAPSQSPAAVQVNQLYTQYLAIAHTTDLTDIARLGIVYDGGKDSQGRPVIVVVGNRLPEDPSALDKVFLYYIKFMDKYADEPYVVLYLHTGMSRKSKPEISWFKKVYSFMDAKYGHSLVAIHVVHPTFWLKVVEKLLSVFVSSDQVLDKIIYHENIMQMWAVLKVMPLIPKQILEYDAAKFGPLPPAASAQGSIAAPSASSQNM